MFTGLIEEVASVVRVEGNHAGAHIHLKANKVLEDVHLGDSIAVNGVCLTVVAFSADSFAVDAVPETMRRTTLGSLAPSHPVNLERALRAGDRFGGHIVSGHVDGVGRIVGVVQEGSAKVISITADPSVLRYVVEKGSVCIDGISLTVMDVAADTFRVSIIPHTAAHTTLAQSRVGMQVNIECDIIAKYVERLMAPGRANGSGSSGLTLEMLAEHGFA